MPVVLITLGIILGCIILILVLLFTVRIYIRIQMTEELALSVRVFGLSIPILPKKEKKYKLSDYTLKKIRKRERKQAKQEAKKLAAAKKKAQKKALKKAKKEAAEAKLTKAEKRALKQAKRAKRPKITEFIPLTTGVAKLFFSRFFGRIHIQMARLHITVGGKDAAGVAMMYGMLYPSLEMMISTLKRVCRVKDLEKADIQLLPDYTSEKISFDCDITFRVTLGGVVGAALKAGWSFLMGYNKIKPDPHDRPPSVTPPLPPLPWSSTPKAEESPAADQGEEKNAKTAKKSKKKPQA